MGTKISEEILDEIYGRKRPDLIAMGWTTKKDHATETVASADDKENGTAYYIENRKTGGGILDLVLMFSLLARQDV